MPALHDKRLPNETPAYRKARDKLLAAERDLRKRVETVAALRRKLPQGGEVPEDYVFETEEGPRRLSQLFGKHDTLAVYSFMFGPNAKTPCPMCSAFLDSLDGAAPHLAQRIALAVVAKSPLDRIREFASARGWQHLRLVSSKGNSYNRDYFGETASGDQMPVMNIFVRRNGKIRHFYQTELLYLKAEKGQDPRHVDPMWPLWNVLDLTPKGRGESWRPKLAYGAG
jgi:predicted dithiol-disulfide oxidoreductase (DUF899 family)